MIESIELLTVGRNVTFERMATIKGGLNRMEYPSLVVLLKHSLQGYILFNTGYAPRYFQHRKRFPLNIASKLLPLTLDEKDILENQLRLRNLSFDDIETVILSHFHAEHISGSKDFKKAQFIYSKSAWNAIKNWSPFELATTGFSQKWLPEDFQERSQILRESQASPWTFFRSHWSLFEGDIILVGLPGHRTGQIGLYTECGNCKFFFVCDAFWLKENLEGARPSSYIKFFVDDYYTFRETLGLLREFKREHPDVMLVPSHCYQSIEDAQAALISDNIQV